MSSGHACEVVSPVIDPRPMYSTAGIGFSIISIVSPDSLGGRSKKNVSPKLVHDI